jgi:hypothetical protein
VFCSVVLRCVGVVLFALCCCCVILCFVMLPWLAGLRFTLN